MLASAANDAKPIAGHVADTALVARQETYHSEENQICGASLVGNRHSGSIPQLCRSNSILHNAEGF